MIALWSPERALVCQRAQVVAMPTAPNPQRPAPSERMCEVQMPSEAVVILRIPVSWWADHGLRT